MNRGMLDANLLTDNIKMIEFYANEEKEMLRKITNKLAEVSGNYNSSNTKRILDTVSDLGAKIEDIYEKRLQYTFVLNRVIKNYDRLSQYVVETFEMDVKR